jgi:hypothetical protein
MVRFASDGWFLNHEASDITEAGSGIIWVRANGQGLEAHPNYGDDYVVADLVLERVERAGARRRNPHRAGRGRLPLRTRHKPSPPYADACEYRYTAQVTKGPGNQNPFPGPKQWITISVPTLDHQTMAWPVGLGPPSGSRNAVAGTTCHAWSIQTS